MMQCCGAGTQLWYLIFTCVCVAPHPFIVGSFERWEDYLIGSSLTYDPLQAGILKLGRFLSLTIGFDIFVQGCTCYQFRKSCFSVFEYYLGQSQI